MSEQEESESETSHGREADLEQLESVLARRALAEAHYGPIPSPADVVAYEHVLPGSVNRLLTMAENEQRHRHELELQVIQAEQRLRVLGQFLAAMVLLAVLGTGVYLALEHSGWPSTILLSAASLAVVALMLSGTRTRSAREAAQNE